MRNAALMVACAVALAGGCSRIPPPADRPSAAEAPSSRGSVLRSLVRSNVSREDYVGSEVCAGCHPDVASAWARSPMHRMTRNVRDADIHAPFDGTRWRFKEDAVVLEQRGADRLLRVEPAHGAPQTFRLTRVIGGRTREDFVGIDVDGGQDELVLPVSFLLTTRTLRYKGYSVMVHEREGLRAGPMWRQTCIFCHNTIPELDRLLGNVAGAGAHPYQGETVERWLPEGRRARFEVTDPQAFRVGAQAEVARLRGPALDGDLDPRQTARRTISVVRAGFDAASLVELGIGCEACHGGGREHVASPAVHPSLVPAAPWLGVALPKPGGRAAAINRVCARCHQVLFSRYPFTWEGGRRDTSPTAAGGSHINSGEARDFLLGACADAMPCTTCHDQHGGSDRERLRALAGPAGNAVCVGCHAELADANRLRAHAHHDPTGPGGACLACHMPRKNMGLDGNLTRYHRIGRPTDPERVLGDRPLECALCHVGRPVRALVDAMEAWWPVRYPRQRLEELYGSLDADVLRATLERGKPHEQAVAVALLGEARARDAAPAVGRLLLSDYPLVREWARRSLESMLGRCDVDLMTSDREIARQGAACVGAPLAGAPGVSPREEEPED